MKPSPLGSRILSAYAILFAGLAPAALMLTAVVNGVASLPSAIGVVSLSVAIVYYGVLVFAGNYAVARVFGLLVAVNYLGLTATNAWNFNEFPDDSRAAQMAVSRMIRGVIFASVYIWYYWYRKKTMDGFTPRAVDEGSAISSNTVS